MPTTLDSILNSQFAAPKSSSGKARAGKNSLDINDFYKLLATQLKYQDADNPMDTSEMMAQMVQTHLVEAVTQMTQVNTITYAASMVGKEVSMAEVDSFGKFTGEVTKGVVTGMIMGDNPILFIGEKGYFMSQIMTIGEVPEKPEDDPTDPSDPTDPTEPTDPPVPTEPTEPTDPGGTGGTA